MEFLEKNKGWKEPDFDTVLQYLRTVLLRRKSTLGSGQSFVANLFRRRLPHLHLTEHALSTSPSPPLDTRHHLSPQTTVLQA